jgi:hypothetical protein
MSPLRTKKEKYQTIAANAEYMPFCTSCGAEISAEKKFCTSCGVPMDRPAGPAIQGSPVLPFPVQPVPQQPVPTEKPGIPKKTLLIIGIAAVLVILAAFYVAGIPMLKALFPQQPVQTPVPGTTAPRMTTYAQPSKTPSKTPTLPPAKVTPLEIFEVRDGKSYEQVYTLTKDFSNGQKEVFSHDLTRPPLYIKFSLTPDMVTRDRVINIGLSSEKTIKTTDTSPDAWFEVKVLDAESGAVIDKQGFQKQYSGMTKQEFMVLNKGDFNIEISGNDVLAEVRILVATS